MNYKSISIIAVTLYMALGVNAQTMLDSLISRYDSLQPYVPTGILADRNPQSALIANWANPLHHTGHTDSVLDFSGFKHLYQWAYYAAYQPNSLFGASPAMYDSLLDVARYGSYIHNLPLSQQINIKPKADVILEAMALQYNQISQMAWDSAYVQFDSLDNVYKLNAGNIHLNDTIWLDTTNFTNYKVMDTVIWINPSVIAGNAFTQQLLLAFSTFNAVAYVPTPTVQFYINPLGLPTNMPNVLLEVDFGDGNGFLPMPADSITIAYPAFGDYTLTLRINDTCSGFECKTATTMLKVVQAFPPAYSIALPQQVNSCTIPMPEGIGEGFGHVYFRFDSLNPVTKIMKPVIIVEGFETKPNFSPTIDPCDYFGCGELNWATLSSGVFGNEKTPLDSIKYFIDSLRYAGFDVVFVDFKTNRTVIQQNGNLVINLIQYINQQLVDNGSDEEIVVLGASMGGLIARYAVRKMEMEQCCHNAKLFLTFSSPHRGANIPLGLQEFLFHLGNGLNPLGLGEGAKKSYDYILNSPVARQMLIYHRDASASVERLAFQTMLDSMGQPQECRIVALTNGSETALGQNNNGIFLQEGDPLLEIKLKTIVPVVVPDFLVTPVLQTGSLVSQNFNNGNFTLLYAKAKALRTSTAPYVVLERGDNFNANFNRLILQDVLYLGGMTALAFNAKAHGAAFWSAMAASAGACIGCPPITASRVFSTAVISTAFSSMLLANRGNNEYHNNTNQQYWEWTSNTLGYDNAPGDYTDTQEDIQKLGGGLVKAHFPLHNFISSVSALDVDTNHLHLNVYDAKILFKELTPFKNYWAPPRKGEISPNQAHVQVGMSNIQWVLNEVRTTNYDLREPNDPKYKNLNTYYNFARPADETVPFQQFVRRVDIQVNGQLHVNNFGPIGYISGSETPTEHTHFVLKTSAGFCDSANMVSIKNGGQFIIGDDNYSAIGASNTADMHFRANSILEIENGGTLRINDNSKLVLEPGAELIIHPGAILDLAGPNAVLELQGKVTLLPGASLNPSGSGIVRFAQAMQNSADANTYWDVVPGTEVKITGTNGQKRAEITTNTYMPAALDSVVFSGVSTTLPPDVALHIYKPVVRFTNSNFVGADTTQQHNGVHLAGQRALLGNSKFKHGTVGLYNNLSLGSGGFSATQCTFSHNTTGLHLRDAQSLQLQQCTARYNQDGLLVEDAQGDVQIIGGTFARNTISGIDISAQSGVTLFVEEAALNNNGGGINAVKANVNARCSNFNNNTVGISAYYNNFVLLGDGAQNTFAGCTHAILLNQASGVFLENGQNNFSGATWYVQGELTALNANPSIDVLHNLMPGTGGSGNAVSLPIHVYWVDAQNNQQQIPVSNWNPLVTLPSNCAPLPGGANPGNDLASDIMMGFTSGKVVNTANYTNVWLHQALADAAHKVSNPNGIYNDLQAIARFNEILGSISGNLTDVEQQALNFAAELMITALNNTYEQGLVPQNGGEEGNPEHPYLQLVSNQLNSLLANTGLSAEEHFNLSLSLAQTYRMAEHFDYALNVLDSLASPVTAEQLVHTEYWSCVCEAEEKLLQEAITPDEFIIAQENCRSILLQYNKWQQEILPGYTEVKDSREATVLMAPLYPNPAVNGTFIQLVEPGSIAIVQLLDVTGKRLYEQTIPETESSLLLDLRPFPPGVYLVKVTQNNQSQVQRLVLSR